MLRLLRRPPVVSRLSSHPHLRQIMKNPARIPSFAPASRTKKRVVIAPTKSTAAKMVLIMMTIRCTFDSRKCRVLSSAPTRTLLRPIQYLRTERDNRSVSNGGRSVMRSLGSSNICCPPSITSTFSSKTVLRACKSLLLGRWSATI
jgi:hypothetical protein